jgi:plasmid stabilization system protein ParE
MSRYTVTWLKDVEGDLARIWVAASDRQAVARAADAADAELAVDAERKGTALSEGLRSLYVPPLHVLFTVRQGDRLVEVVRVRADRPPDHTETNGAGQPGE